ncbi:MAG: NACHT domain-containing protein, partial [Anaerolineae bacterium]|nr:NACHT domain-containing protein [Anaerolineae bacterium]MDW8070983.1 NACHT domain-containing protein [Anaerolineae bacterium]
MDEEERFRHELFIESEHYEESPLRDRKAMLPDPWNDECIAEFIRDVIALANTARMLGRPGYLLYGLDDQGRLCGIESSEHLYDRVRGLTTGERVKHRLQQVIQRYIKPVVKWDLNVSQIDSIDIAYLIIHPLPPPSPYQVKAQFPAKGEPKLRPGQCWIRFGESKIEIKRQEIAPDENPYCYSYSQVPYVLPSVWEAYLSGLLNDRKIDLGTAQSIKPYQDLYNEQGIPLQSVVDDFLLSSDDRLLVISGSAGSGKTAFIQRLVANLAQDGLEVIKQLIREESFRPPRCWIPIYLRLRDEAIDAQWRLERSLLDSVNKVSKGAFFGRREERPTCPEVLLRNPNLKWLVCLDGLDELDTERQRQNFIRRLHAFMQEFTPPKIILSTRTDVMDDRSLQQSGNVVRIASLNQQQILAYIRGYLSSGDERTYRELLDLLDKEPELWRVLSSPACLEAAIPEITGSYPNSLEPLSVSLVSQLQETSDLTKESILAKAREAYRRA